MKKNPVRKMKIRMMKNEDDEEEDEGGPSAQAYRVDCVLMEDFDIKCRSEQEEDLLVQLTSSNGQLPVRTTEGAAGYDLFAAEEMTMPAQDHALIKTDISLVIPEGYYGQIKLRSGLALKKHITTDAGVIDRDYTGNIGVILVNREKEKLQGAVWRQDCPTGAHQDWDT